ncbi:glutathione S-transferase family protein [Serpentinimonas barnesii]|uniref:glutathione S-transferase family protein n=1 Tax=Serpentinimonas barnesii TaxID=1458427 RepID=UPI0009E6196D|nr:glutathione S-transferase [Serpentinimonas barnesii]
MNPLAPAPSAPPNAAPADPHTQPLVLHHLEQSRSQRVLWLLEEMGLPYELKTYARQRSNRLAPPELKAVHPLGKSPVLGHGELVLAESGAILEYLAETFPERATGDLAQLLPAPGTPEHRRCRFWLHYAEGSLMPWLLMKLVFQMLPRQPMPFFVRPVVQPIVHYVCQQVQHKLIDPNLQTALPYIEQELAQRPWFAGAHLSLADFQMSYPLEAALSRLGGAPGSAARKWPHIHAWLERVQARPAYQRALAKGGPVMW